jgi:hypothetical protein
MVYHSTDVGPTQGQLADLAEGLEVKLSPQHLKGDVTFHLTGTQLKRLQAAQASGRGCTLKFSKAQLKHTAQHGSGRFSDLLKTGYSFLKPSLAKGVDAGASWLAGKAADKLKDVVGLSGSGIGPHYPGHRKHMQDGSGWGDILKQIAHGAVDVGANLLGGKIRKGPHYIGHRKHMQDGSGWGDILKQIAHGAVDVGANMLGGKIRKGPHYPGHRKHMQDGSGWGDILKQIAHGAVDVGANLLGGGLQPNPYANPMEGLRAAVLQKKITVGRGLYM